MTPKRPFFSLLVFCILCVAAALPARAGSPGSAAPDFTLPDISGKKISLSEGKGKVVLLNFWATWCGPCRAEMPSLVNLYRELREKGLVVLAVSVDTTVKPVQVFAAEKSLPFPVLLDTDKEVYFDKYAVFGLPTSFLIDRKGMIVEKIMGETVWDSPSMKEKILTLLHRR
ncbi:MAG: TlpA family protein disulfide reductase [Alphaproteobacteria bacterium]|uniref:TlpA family protein disulfide reductase n=1 Tax=Candidatus Nitrobium versatile TaxID=2884831 RepID=A0A953JBT1_9BACT|nr:TlpA family protein disulfide reductase [Candidatus Nitrobium versatile]